MSNQEILNEAIRTDQQVFHNLLVAREFLEGLPFFKRSVKQLELEVRMNLYRARQLALLESSKRPQRAYKRPYTWLVQKFTFGNGDAIGAIPLIPIAIIAATAFVGGSWGNTYISKSQEAKRDLGITQKLLQQLAEESDPEVKKAIAARLNIKVPGQSSMIQNILLGLLGLGALKVGVDYFK